MRIDRSDGPHGIRPAQWNPASLDVGGCQVAKDVFSGVIYNYCYRKNYSTKAARKFQTAFILLLAAKSLLSHPADEKLEFIPPPIEAGEFLSNLLNSRSPEDARF